jgi:hypothetical protein
MEELGKIDKVDLVGLTKSIADAMNGTSSMMSSPRLKASFTPNHDEQPECDARLDSVPR